MASPLNRSLTAEAESIFFKFKLPTEVRRLIFIQAAFIYFDEEPYPWSNNRREIIYQPLRCDWIINQLQPSAPPISGSNTPRLERALLNHKQLYYECIQARLSVSVLVIKAGEEDEETGLIHPVFGRDMPFYLLDYFRHIRYQACDRYITKAPWNFGRPGHGRSTQPRNRCMQSFISIQESLRSLTETRKTRLGAGHSKHFVVELAGDREDRPLESPLPSLGEYGYCCFKDIDEFCVETLGFHRAKHENTGSKVFVESRRDLTSGEAELCRKKGIAIPKVYRYHGTRNLDGP